MVKLIFVAIIALIVGGLVGFIIGYCSGSYSQQTNHLGVKKNSRLRL